MADNFSLKAILSAVDKMSPVFKSVGNAAQATHKHLADLGKAASGVAGKLGLPISLAGGLAAGFSIGKIKSAVTGFGELSEEIHKGALVTGTSIDEFQRWRFVAQQAGIPIEALAGGMGKLNRNIGDAASGKNKAAAGLFRALHINLKGANGQFKSGAELLPKLADAFVENRNPVLQARMGMALFGKTWQEMIPLLMEGSEGITETLQRFSEVKKMITPEDIKAGREFRKEMLILDGVMQGFAGAIAKNLIPFLTPLVKEFTAWAVVNRNLVGQQVAKVVREFIDAARSFDWKGFFGDLKSIGAAFGRFIDFVGGARNALIGLVLFMNIGAIGAVFSLIGALGRLLIFVGGPLMSGLAAAFGGTTLAGMMAKGLAGLASGGLAVAAAAALGYGLGTLVAMGINKGLSAVMGGDRALGAEIFNLVEDGTARVTAAWEKVKGWFTDYYEWLFGKWNEFTGLIQSAANLVSGMFSQAVQIASSIASVIGGGSGANAGGADGRPRNLPGSLAARVGGEVKITLGNAPAGTRVESIKTEGDVALTPSVGYRSFAMGGET